MKLMTYAFLREVLTMTDIYVNEIIDFDKIYNGRNEGNEYI